MAVVANDCARQSAAVVTRTVDAMQRIEAFSTSVRPLAVYGVVMHPAKGSPLSSGCSLLSAYSTFPDK